MAAVNELNSTNFPRGKLSISLIIPALALNLVSNLGILLNFSIIFVTIKSNSLRGTANFLLALISFYEILHQMGHLILLIVVISGINFIDFLTANRIILPTVFGMNASMFGITTAAADRLFAILAKNWHTQINKKIYLGLHLIFTILFGFYCAFGFYSSALEQSSHPPIFGSIADIIVGPFLQIWAKLIILLNLLAIFCYLLIWIVVKKQNAVTQNTSSHLLKSLLLIVLCNVGGYLANISLLFLFDKICNSCFSNTLIGWQLSFINQILMNLAVAINAPILYFTSTEYRKAYQKYIFAIFSKKYQKSKVMTSKMPNKGNAIGTIMRNNLISNE